MKIKSIKISNLKIKKLPENLVRQGWLGMNQLAAKENKVNIKLNAREIAVKKTLSNIKYNQTIKHEAIELNAMQSGMKYKQAHKLANKLEKQSVTEINKYLSNSKIIV